MNSFVLIEMFVEIPTCTDFGMDTSKTLEETDAAATGTVNSGEPEK